MFTVYIGQEVGYGSWVSSFAVMEHVATPLQAAFVSEIFWITNTLSRLVLMYLSVKVSSRLKFLSVGMLVSSGLNLIAVSLGHHWFAAYMGSFMNGMFLAGVLALFLALPL